MTSSGNNFNDFSKIAPTREITTKIEKTFFSRPWPWVYFLNEPNAAASIAPTIIRPCTNTPDCLLYLEHQSWLRLRLINSYLTTADSDGTLQSILHAQLISKDHATLNLVYFSSVKSPDVICSLLYDDG